MVVKLKSLLVIFLVSAVSLAQTPAPDGVITLRTNYFYNFEVYYLLDFDFNNGRNNPDMFSYSLSYTPNEPNGAPIDIKLEFEWIANIPAVNMYNNRILYIISKPFEFKGEITLTTKDIDQNMRNIYYTDGRPCNIGVDRLEQDLLRLQSVILSTGGKLPAGSYIFNLNILDKDGVPTGFSQTQTIEVSNPTTMDLISPGGELEENFEISTPLPTFQWESIDFMWSKVNCNKCGYWIRVAEYDASRHNSIDQALKDRANLPFPDNGDYYELPSSKVAGVSELDLWTAGTIFQYPLTGAKPLEAGKTYVWQIRKTFPTSSGSESVYSPIYAFKIQAAGQTTSSYSGIDLSLYQALIDQISPDIQEWFKEGGDLYGYVPTGTVTLNGVQRLTLDQLQTLVNQLVSEQVSLKSITVE